MKYPCSVVAVMLGVLAYPALAAKQTDVCNIDKQVTQMFHKDGPLKGCNTGDIAHFQIDRTLVSPATVAARYCDFSSEIIVDTIASNNVAHLVCRYKWKWSKSVTMQKHPDTH